MHKAAQTVRLATDVRLEASHSGIGTYSRNLRQAQLSISPAALRIDDDRHGLVPSRQRRWLRALLPTGIKLRQSGETLSNADIFRLAQVWFDVHRTLLPLAIGGPPGIVHWSHAIPVRMTGWINIYTVHDAIPLSHPELSRISTTRYRRLLAAIHSELGRGGAIATVTEAARTEISHHTGIPVEQIDAVGQSVAKPPPSSCELPNGLRSGGYILACGSVELRKNSLKLMEAYLESGLALPLVFAGPSTGQHGWMEEEIAQHPGVIRLPIVDEPMMTCLIFHAKILAMVSLAEGFGLPVVEAMALGTPVLAADIPAIREVSGGAARLVAPTDGPAIAASLAELASDEALRETLISRGHANAKRFTLEKFADRLSNLYDRLLLVAS